MSDRTTAERWRDINDDWHGMCSPDGRLDVGNEAVQLLAELDALRVKVPCLTCGGDGVINARWDQREGHELGDPCPNPDCTDGTETLSWESMSKIVAAVWDDNTMPPCALYLRGIR